MLMVISPAKTLDFASPAVTEKQTLPDLLSDSRLLMEELRTLAPQDISTLMHISDKLGVLNYDRFQAWKTPFPKKQAKQAVLAFKGDVYTGLEAETFNAKAFDFAQKHLRILSGLYGVLRPLDNILPYRLEMGTKLANQRGKNLYEFWGDKITDAVASAMMDVKSQTLVNLASNEYFKVVNTAKLNTRIVTPVFKDRKNGEYKIISFYAKKARGLMAAWVIREQIEDVEALKAFTIAGYRFDPERSKKDEWVFIRDEQN